MTARQLEQIAALAATSRGLPRLWRITRDGRLLDYIRCPDAATAEALATYRHGLHCTATEKVSP